MDDYTGTLGGALQREKGKRGKPVLKVLFIAGRATVNLGNL